MQVAEQAGWQNMQMAEQAGWQNRHGGRTSMVAEEDCRRGKAVEEVRWQRGQMAARLGYKIMARVQDHG